MGTIDYGDIVGGGPGLPAEQRHDGLAVVVGAVGKVEAVEAVGLAGRRQGDVAEFLLCEKSADHGFVAFEKVVDELRGIGVGGIFSLYPIAAAEDEHLDVERNAGGAVADAQGLHGAVHECVAGKNVGVPGEHGVCLQLQVVLYFMVWISLIAALSAHLFLTLLQIVEHCCRLVMLGIDGQRLDKHAHRAVEPLVGASVIDGGEERLPLVVVFGQQISICTGEQGASEDSVFLAEVVHLGLGDVQGPQRVGFGGEWVFQVRHEGSRHLAAVEGSGVPLPGLFAGRRFCRSGLPLGFPGHCQPFGRKGAASVGSLDVFEYDFH